MITNINYIYIIILTLGYCHRSVAQSNNIKFEREARIGSKAVPPAALALVNGCAGKLGKVRWFREYSDQGISYEAKYKIYSLEFDTLGRLQDIEIDIRLNKIPQGSLSAIQKTLSDRYEYYKIEKAQEQWTGDSDDLKQRFCLGNGNVAFELRYELEMRTESKQGGVERYEALFDMAGNLLQTKRIANPDDEHLEY